jgi:hypothetical protein
MQKTTDFQNRWALVTGASSGIGVALARELAAQGAKLILTARRRDRLDAFAAELAANGTETRVVVADLNDPEAPQQIFAATEGAGLVVDILVNNAGFGLFGAFSTSDADQAAGMVRVNCEAVVRLSRLFLPRMVERRRGWMLVVASAASFQPVPYLSTYAATKAFARFFALGVGAEVARFGVKVTALCPGRTESEFFEVADASKFRGPGVQSAEDVARIGIHALTRGQHTISPKLTGKLRSFLVRFLPVDMITWSVEKLARPKGEPSS